MGLTHYEGKGAERCRVNPLVVLGNAARVGSGAGAVKDAVTGRTVGASVRMQHCAENSKCMRREGIGCRTEAHP